MMSEVEGNTADLVKKFTTTFQSGEYPGLRIKTLLIGTYDTVSGRAVQKGTVFARINRAFGNDPAYGKGLDGAYKVNMVADVDADGYIIQINDIAMNGVKPTQGLPLIVRPNGVKAVTADIMTEVSWDYPINDPEFESVMIKSVKFRP